ncbi:MAG: response regulator transcription factor, partial [Roseburia lenta]|nr:response regulator transcription factor [Roseburia lenta]
DDYLVKPFSYNELVSRAKALIRRYHVYRGKLMSNVEQTPKESTTERIISYQNIVLNETKREVSRDGQVIELTDTEYALLHLLLTNRRQIFSAEHLYESVWQEEYYYGANNTVMVHMRNLRRKIEEDPKNPTIVKTVWGRGYRCD